MSILLFLFLICHKVAAADINNQSSNFYHPAFIGEPPGDRNVFVTIHERHDGVGAMITRLVPAKAFAESRGWAFAGIFGGEERTGGTLTPHHVEDLYFLRQYFGNASTLYFARYRSVYVVGSWRISINCCVSMSNYSRKRFKPSSRNCSKPSNC